MSKESFIDKLIRYKKLIAGTWLSEDGKYIYNFAPLFNLSVSANVVITDLNLKKKADWEYSLIPQAPISQEREDGVPVDNPIIEFQFGLQINQYEIKFLSETMLIIFPKNKPELEEIFTKKTI